MIDVQMDVKTKAHSTYHVSTMSCGKNKDGSG